jgi:hypothetical protein
MADRRPLTAFLLPPFTSIYHDLPRGLYQVKNATRRSRRFLADC